VSNNLGIKIIAIDGVMPSKNTISAGQYTLIRSYGFTVPKGTLDPLIKKFIDYAKSENSKMILESNGFIVD
jgi:ABC-type phosphate transport system substrate-binding protein